MYFNYFFPGRRTMKLDDLMGAGLGYVFDPESASIPKATFTPCAVYNGPGGQNGIVVSPSDKFVGYYPKVQTWKQQIGAEYWVGMWREQRPTPETLARENQISGGSLRLDDGNCWLFPKARHFEEFEDEILLRPMLPARLMRDESGEWQQGEVKERYRKLWQYVNAFVEAVVNDEQHFADYDNLVVEAFRANYKVSAIEIDLLGVYDDTVRDRVIRIVTDLDGYADLIKKKLARLASGNSSNGQSGSRPAEDTESIGQRSPT